MVLDKEAVFVKPQCLFELNQHLFGQPMPGLLLEDQGTEQPAPDEAGNADDQRIEAREPILLWAQEECKQHGNQA